MSSNSVDPFLKVLDSIPSAWNILPSMGLGVFRYGNDMHILR